jgi:hypothetical protein
MTDSVAKGKRIGGGQYAILAIPTSQPTFFKEQVLPSGRKIIIPSRHKVYGQQKVMVQQQPNTSIASGFYSGGQVDFRLDRGSIDVLNHCYIKANVTNTSGASCTILPLQLAIQRLEIYGANGSNLLATVYGQELYLSNMFFSNNEFLNSNAQMGLTNTFAASGVVIAAGASQNLYCPLVHLFTSTQLMMAGLNSEVLIRVYMENSNLTLIAGTLPITNTVSVLMKGNQLSEGEKKRQLELYRNPMPLILPYLNWNRMNQTLTLAPSTTYTVIMSALQGFINSVIFTLRASPLTNTALATYVQVADYDIQDQSGQSLLGYYRRTEDDNQIENGENFDNLFGLSVQFYNVSFSDNFVNDYTMAQNSGCQPLDGFARLSFTTTSTMAAGSYLLDIRSLDQQYLEIVKGEIKSSRP